MHVLITGAAGGVGSLLAPRLADRHQLTLVDVVTNGRDDIRAVDVRDVDGMAEVMTGVDAVVHLAGEPSPSASWEALRGPNVDGLVATFEAARRAGVGRLLFASTNHVTGRYDIDRDWPITPERPIRPDSLYGATKAFGEAVGRYYADTSDLAVICVRIGWVLERPHNEQARMMWLSPDDLARFVEAALASTVTFGIYYGVSANTRRQWSIANARRDLGYEPLDDSEVFFSPGA